MVLNRLAEWWHRRRDASYNDTLDVLHESLVIALSNAVAAGKVVYLNTTSHPILYRNNMMLKLMGATCQISHRVCAGAWSVLDNTIRVQGPTGDVDYRWSNPDELNRVLLEIWMGCTVPKHDTVDTNTVQVIETKGYFCIGPVRVYLKDFEYLEIVQCVNVLTGKPIYVYQIRTGPEPNAIVSELYSDQLMGSDDPVE